MDHPIPSRVGGSPSVSCVLARCDWEGVLPIRQGSCPSYILEMDIGSSLDHPVDVRFESVGEAV